MRNAKSRRRFLTVTDDRIISDSESMNHSSTMKVSISPMKTDTLHLAGQIPMANNPFGDLTNINAASNSIGKKTAKSASKVRQVPNFAKIHKNARGECIEEYEARKMKRRQNLLAAGERYSQLATPRAESASKATKKSKKTSSPSKSKVAFRFATPKRNPVIATTFNFCDDVTPAKSFKEPMIIDTPDDKVENLPTNSYATRSKQSANHLNSQVAPPRKITRVNKNTISTKQVGVKLTLAGSKNQNSKASKSHQNSKTGAQQDCHYMRSTVAATSRVTQTLLEREQKAKQTSSIIKHRGKLAPYVDTTQLTDRQFEEYRTRLQMEAKLGQKHKPQVDKYKPKSTAANNIATYRESTRQEQNNKRKSRSDLLRNKHRLL